MTTQQNDSDRDCFEVTSQDEQDGNCLYLVIFKSVKTFSLGLHTTQKHARTALFNYIVNNETFDEWWDKNKKGLEEYDIDDMDDLEEDIMCQENDGTLEEFGIKYDIMPVLKYTKLDCSFWPKWDIEDEKECAKKCVLDGKPYKVAFPTGDETYLIV